MMRQPSTPRMLPDALLDYLFAGMPGGSVAELRAYCARGIAASPRFKAFAAENRDKIRKKIREARDAERLRDLRLELDTAYRLLDDRHLAVAYEKHAASKIRAPDFTATYTSKFTFHVEVKRLRGPNSEVKWGDAICAKLGQLLPAAINIIVIGADGQTGEAADPPRAMAALRDRAERKDDDYFAHRAFRDARDFLRQFQRLSGVVFRIGWAQEDGGTSLLWDNNLARQPLPPELRRILAR
jgi:hypothetical protein